MGFHMGKLLMSRRSWLIPANVLFRPARTPWGGSLVNLREVCQKKQTVVLLLSITVKDKIEAMIHQANMLWHIKCGLKLSTV
jgi:hypothetical protein